MPELMAAGRGEEVYIDEKGKLQGTERNIIRVSFFSLLFFFLFLKC